MNFENSRNHQSVRQAMDVAQTFKMGNGRLAVSLVPFYKKYFVEVLKEHAAAQTNLPQAESYMNAARFLEAL